MERSKASCFGLLRGEIEGRIDANYWRLTPLVKHRFANPRFKPEALGKSLELIQYGSSGLAHSAPIGIPILRMNNLQDDAWDLSNLKYIEMSERELENFRLEAGDILFNRTNSKELVGKCEVFTEAGDWVFASYLIRVRTNSKRLLPDFLSNFLSTSVGRLQIDRLSRQIIGMTNINSDEICELLVPMPPVSRQKQMIASMNLARSERRRRQAEANALLDGMDSFIAQVLGLSYAPPDNRRAFAVKRQDVANRTLSPNAHFPALQTFLSMLSTGKYPTRALGSEIWINPPIQLDGRLDDDEVSFVPMDAVADGATGEVTLRNRRLGDVRKGYTPFAENDVLWAKITPCMENGKTFIATGLQGGIGFGSTEFHVLRPRNSNVTADYVFAFLAQSSLRHLARYAFTGSAGHQRVPENFLAALPFPIPPKEVQRTITDEMQRRRAEARRLRAEADTDWKSAKSWLEEQLLGPADQ